MQHSQHGHNVERLALFLKTEAAVRTIQDKIEALLASESYNKESAQFVECMTAVIHETVERAKHNDGSMEASYETLQTSTSKHIENMLDNLQFSQCISESEEILRTIEEVMLAQ